MPLSFPANPTLNQTYTYSDITWTFNGNGWTKSGAGGASITVSGSVPASPNEGALWFNSESGETGVYFGNGWVAVGGAGGGGSGGPGATGATGPTGTNAAVYNVSANTSGYFSIPVGNIAQRPNSVSNGAMRINSTSSYVELFYNNDWFNLQYIGILTASGGTVTTSGNYKIHTFISSSSFVVANAPNGATIEVLLVGGGGSGGTGYAGGGGAGGYYYNSLMSISAGTYAVTIGAGGTSTVGNLSAGTNGSDSTFNNVIAYGGGGGGAYNAIAVAKARDGGSGGGAAGAGTTSGNIGLGSQGFNGGVGFGTSTSNALGGGGGGAGAVGTAAVGGVSGSGGVGLLNPISGSTTGHLVGASYYFAGGGAGGGGVGTAGAGGSGGGGQGQIVASNGLIPHSVNFSSWTIGNATVSNTNNLAPDGTLTATLISMTSSSYDLYYNQTGLSVGTTYYFTIWVKLGTATNFVIAFNNSNAWNTIAGNKAYTSADGLNTSTWTKIVHSFTAPSGVNMHLGGHADSPPQQTTGTLYLWGPMLYTASPVQASSGLVNTGGGGGGGGAWNTGFGGNGGSGVAIIRYRYQ